MTQLVLIANRQKENIVLSLHAFSVPSSDSKTHEGYVTCHVSEDDLMRAVLGRYPGLLESVARYETYADFEYKQAYREYTERLEYHEKLRSNLKETEEKLKTMEKQATGLRELKTILKLGDE